MRVTCSASSRVRGGRIPAEAPRQHRLAGARRSDEQRVVAAGSGDRQRADRRGVPADVAQVLAVGPARRRGRCRRKLGRWVAAQDRRDSREIAHSGDCHAFDEAGLRRALARDDESVEPVAPCALGHGERPAARAQLAAEGQLAEDGPAVDALRRHLAAGDEQSARRREVVARPRLREVRGCEVDRDAPVRELEAGVAHGGVHALARLTDGGVAAADDGEARKAGAQIDLDGDPACGEAVDGEGGEAGEHGPIVERFALHGTRALCRICDGSVTTWRPRRVVTKPSQVRHVRGATRNAPRSSVRPMSSTHTTIAGSRDPRRALGALGEGLALAHLERLGYALVARNHRTRWGEIDLIVFDGTTLVFVEVKTRRASGRAGSALDAVAPVKQQQVRRIAAAWLAEVADRPQIRRAALRRGRGDRQRDGGPAAPRPPRGGLLMGSALDELELRVGRRLERHAVQRRDADPADRRPVIWRRVADVRRELPAGVPRVGADHVAIACDLGDDRRGGDGCARRVAVDDRAPIVAVQVAERRSRRTGGSRPVARPRAARRGEPRCSSCAGRACRCSRRCARRRRPSPRPAGPPGTALRAPRGRAAWSR